MVVCFNTQPPEGGWEKILGQPQGDCVSTHSRPKAAGDRMAAKNIRLPVSTHSRPKAAGTVDADTLTAYTVSTHSRPKAAGLNLMRGGFEALFQHTAARRRLDERDRINGEFASFNTQPPEGGWPLGADARHRRFGFQHTAARRRLAEKARHGGKRHLFQHTAARRRLDERDCITWQTCKFQHTAARRRLDW